jgi:hypothetical protein
MLVQFLLDQHDRPGDPVLGHHEVLGRVDVQSSCEASVSPLVGLINDS